MKTNFIVFILCGRKATSIDLDVKIDNVKTERENYTKFLGVIISENLSWHEFIKTVNSNISNGIQVICRLRYTVSRSVFISLYFPLSCLLMLILTITTLSRHHVLPECWLNYLETKKNYFLNNYKSPLNFHSEYFNNLWKKTTANWLFYV